MARVTKSCVQIHYKKMDLKTDHWICQSNLFGTQSLVQINSQIHNIKHNTNHSLVQFTHE